MSRYLQVAVLAIVAAAWLTAQAADPIPLRLAPKKTGAGAKLEADPALLQSEAASKQEALRRQFDDFKQSLLRLAQRLEASSKPEDREKALVLKKAIALASEQGIDTKFTTLVAALKGTDTFSNLEQLQAVMEKNEDLRKDLRNLIELLLTDDRDAEARRKREEYTRLLERLKEIIATQERIRDQTGLNRRDTKDLQKDQVKVTKQTQDLVARREEKGSKGDSKDAKGDGKNGKPGDSKDAKGDGKAPKGDSKDGKKDGKPGDGKDSKPAEKGKPGGPKSGKPDGKAGDPKAKPSDGKGSDSKSKSDAKSSKGSESKPSDSKSGQGKQGQQSQGKGDQQPNGGNESPPPSGDQQPEENAQVKKQIQDATHDQKKASDELKKNNRPDAVKNQEDALAKLNQAKKQLEDLLKQLREEEIERLLAALQQRCERMLAMQIAVRDGTVALDKVVRGNSDKKPTRADEQQSNILSDREDEIVREASKAFELVKAEGSAVAFAEIFLQVRGDMTTVAGRLRKTDVGAVTVKIEKDIIDTLGEMIEALKKARQENQKPNKPPMPGQGGGQPPEQRLIDMIAELKMIRSMQKRVNDRTETYGKEYEGEQAAATNEMVQRELRELGSRQEKIGRIANDIHKGKNKAN